MSTMSLVRLAAAGTVAAVLAIGTAACGPADDSASSSGSSGTAAGSTAPSASAPASAPAKKKEDKPAVKAAFKGDGTFQVGTDVQPGTYKTSGNDDGMCYWERAKDAKDDTDSILANDTVAGSSYVTIKPTDKIFTSTDCKDWYPAGADKPAAPKTSMGDGMYKVGTDIAAGTYKAKGGEACYWERTKDALHDLDSILANDNVTGQAVVTITAKDAYFKTGDCGTWTKTG
ncbi:hypothetical protein NMG29_03650 [Streptomyces cocklensis]|jgi:hypothetical protein|uniref:Lipoprotein n=1 Tax=Actinacidiphila cocklensis TaxID=887465 RepID=A0A9W4E590_9ACTN|nr:hypothetical protein [Actinacidiphila cocklensis]MDD1057325.1 hypothetical protein [Actinacidiphila cocklensis]WSX79138.1 hypothetical protein OH826_37965 [Streptomyces sp. NBC_00899]CAG6399395.1 conserved exported hypothetical protein [Actinacidiphila cocklensis]